MHSKPLLKQVAYSSSRALIFLCLAILMANYLNGRNFSDYLSKTMIRVHAEARIGLDANLLASLLLEGNHSRLQELLDRNYSIYALVITDCTTTAENCPGQVIGFQTQPQLLVGRQIMPEDLVNYPYLILRRPSSSILQLLQPNASKQGHSGEIIGRVYSISTIPSFQEDYRQWLRHPLVENELWRKYLTTMVSCLAGGLFVWVLLELFLKIRRIELRAAKEREIELIRDADNYLAQLDDKGRQIEDQQRHATRQFENYVGRIKNLEQRLKDVAEYRGIAETLIRDLEEENSRQSLDFKEQLERTNREKAQLQRDVEKFKKAVGRDKQEASRSLSSSLIPRPGFAFEQQVLKLFAEGTRAQSGEWRIISQFDVAAGSGDSRFVDCIVISRECLIVLEIKGYYGIIETDGALENSRWFCRGGSNRTVEVTGGAGVNPYHQVREYVMNLLNLVKYKLEYLPVYGVIVFPEETDISKLNARIGRFYRVTTADRLLSVVGQIEAEARRDNAHNKRSSAEAIEQVMRGT